LGAIGIKVQKRTSGREASVSRPDSTQEKGTLRRGGEGTLRVFQRLRTLGFHLYFDKTFWGENFPGCLSGKKNQECFDTIGKGKGCSNWSIEKRVSYSTAGIPMSGPHSRFEGDKSRKLSNVKAKASDGEENGNGREGTDPAQKRLE